MFELRDSPGKGKGLFVLTTGIQKGDRVITEAPILTADLVWVRLPLAELELHLEEKLQQIPH
ncbi:hypothetical protein ACKVWE_001929 [Pyricularia oryzae]